MSKKKYLLNFICIIVGGTIFGLLQGNFLIGYIFTLLVNVLSVIINRFCK